MNNKASVSPPAVGAVIVVAFAASVLGATVTLRLAGAGATSPLVSWISLNATTSPLLLTSYTPT